MITIETTTNKNTDTEQYTVFYCGEPVASFATREEAETKAALEQAEMEKVEAEIVELNALSIPAATKLDALIATISEVKLMLESLEKEATLLKALIS